MKFFLWFFVIATALCGIFWAVDGPGSGMQWPTGIFGGLLVGVLLYNRVRNGDWLNDKATR